MALSGDIERMKVLLTEAVSVLCRSVFSCKSDFLVEGLIGITFDKNNVVLLNINENIHISPVDPAINKRLNVNSDSRNMARSGSKRKRRKSRASGSESDTGTITEVEVSATNPVKDENAEDDHVWQPPMPKRNKLPPKTLHRKSIQVKSSNQSHEPIQDNAGSSQKITETSDNVGTVEVPSEVYVELETSEGSDGLPIAVKDIGISELRKLVSSLVSSEMPEGVGYPGWGKEGNRPAWWSKDIPWTKHGVQRGVKRLQMEKLLIQAMTYHGGVLPLSKSKTPKNSKKSVQTVREDVDGEYVDLELDEV